MYEEKCAPDNVANLRFSLIVLFDCVFLFFDVVKGFGGNGARIDDVPTVPFRDVRGGAGIRVRHGLRVYSALAPAPKRRSSDRARRRSESGRGKRGIALPAVSESYAPLRTSDEVPLEKLRDLAVVV